MVSSTIAGIIGVYIRGLEAAGLPVSRAILYGSQARGEARADSDIDLLVLSPLFDNLTWEQERESWSIAKDVDWRLEPVLYGEKTYDEDDWHPLIDTIKREGIEIEIHRTPTPLKKV